MMQRRRIIIAGLVLLLSLILAQTVSADTPAPGGPFSTAFRIQNLGSSTATCTYAFYNSSGTASYTSSPTTIAPGDSMYVYTPSIGSLASGSYSGVVSCDQPVGGVVNFSDPDSGASYGGVATPGTTWYAPGIYDNFYNFYSTIIVQNATASSVNITVDIFQAGSSTAVKTQTATGVPAYASVSFEQEGLSELSNNVAYSAKITGTGNLAPVVDIYGRGSADNQLYSYNPFTSGSTTAYAPVIMNNYYGYNTSLTIQNISGTTTANVTVNYGTGQSWSGTIAANSAQQLYTPVSGIPSGTLTGAKVTSDQPVVVLVNESNAYNRAASYSGFSSGGAEVRAPIVMRRYYDYNTSITCQNVGSASTTMTLQYAGISGSNISPSIAPEGTHLFYQPADSLLSDNFIGSATITASQDMVCVVNEDQNEGTLATTAMDQLYAYNGITP